jgi:hypothetical protein
MTHIFSDNEPYCDDCGKLSYSKSEPCFPTDYTKLVDENYRLRQAIRTAYLRLCDPDIGWIQGFREAKKFLEAML